MAINGFAAAFVRSGKLCGSLLAFGIVMPQLLRIDAFSTAEAFLAAVAFVTLPAVLPAILFDLF